uniref:Protein of unassigned function n=1 Tax=Methylobacterium oryzae CBMB20 TaxID=693986 RepID=A0A088B2D7_9HYPH|nr:protein of unassigned function [Methylobacterium oryzae CBMB20]
MMERFRIIDRMLSGVKGGKVVDPMMAAEKERAVKALWKDWALRLLSDSIHAAYDPADDDEKILGRLQEPDRPACQCPVWMAPALQVAN